MTAIEGASVRVAGATTDLGRAITRRLEQRGARVRTSGAADVLVLVADPPAAIRRRTRELAPVLAAHERIVVVSGPESEWETRLVAAGLRRGLAGTRVGVSVVLPAPMPDVGRGPDTHQAAVTAVATLHLAARATVRAIETGQAEIRLPAITPRVPDDIPGDLIDRLLRHRGHPAAVA